MQELYTQKEIKKTRDEFLNAQNGKCLISGVSINGKDACLDHDHASQAVRGVLHRQINVALGRIENSYLRDISWWSDLDLSALLRKIADYLDRDTSKNPLHPAWIKVVKARFNRLPEAKKNTVLSALGSVHGTSSAERKELLRKAILTRQFTYQQLMLAITAAESSSM